MLLLLVEQKLLREIIKYIPLHSSGTFTVSSVGNAGGGGDKVSYVSCCWWQVAAVRHGGGGGAGGGLEERIPTVHTILQDLL